MKHLKQVGLAMALVLLACVGATSASATTISPAGVAVVLTSTNSSLQVHGGGSTNCTNSTISGTTPSTTAATLTIPVTLVYTGCATLGQHTTVSVPAACRAGGAASAVKLNVTYNQAVAPQASVTVTIPAGCTITTSTPFFTCTMTFVGDQTVGAAGGISFTNGSSMTKSFATLTNELVSSIRVEPGGTFGCPTAGAHTGTLHGTYQVTTPATAPGVTVTP